MKKRRVAMTISLPPDLAKNYEKLARQEAKNRSQLFREMFSLYQTRAREREFFELQREGARLARDRGILTEEDVERIVFGSR
jgi:metal-responsive CopG/Arc/MetJ family transcriptional regulator